MSFITLGKTETKRPDTYSVYRILMTLIFLVPLFVVPLVYLPLNIGKGGVILMAISAVLIVWLVSRLKDGALIIPDSIILYSLFIIPAIFLISSFFSTSVKWSLGGMGFEIGTFVSVLMLSLLTYFVATTFQSTKKVFSLYIMMSYSGFIIFGYTLVKILFAGSAFAQKIPLALVGDFNDVAIFFGLLTILAISGIELVALSKRIRYTMYISLFTSILMLAITNFMTVWVIVGLFSLLLFVYSLSFGGRSVAPGESWLPTVSLSIMLISLLFVLAHTPITKMITDTGLNTITTGLRPSWSGTTDIMVETMTNQTIKETLVGSGPNNFALQWQIHKSQDINTTPAWNIDFEWGVGWIPTFAVTTGLLGLLAWLVFLIVYVWRGAQLLILSSVNTDKITRFTMVSSFLAGLYMWVIMIFYVPNISGVLFAYVFTGVFVASLATSGAIKNKKIALLDDPRINFISVLFLLLFLITSIFTTYILTQRTIASTYYFSGINILNTTGEFDEARYKVENASELHGSDLYYRMLSGLYIVKLGQILNSGDSEELIRTQFLETSKKAIDNAQYAIDANELNYLNWLVQAKAYSSLVPFELEGAYEKAKESLDKALELNPKNPSILLERATLELSQGDMILAKTLIQKSLEIKPNYTESIFLLSQIQAEEGDILNAIESTEIATILEPSNIGILFQLGVLKYQNEDYGGAIMAFQRAIVVNPYYANARYFKGLCHDKLGETEIALAEFGLVLESNPSNEEVKKIIENLNNGRGALETISGVKEPELLPE